MDNLRLAAAIFPNVAKTPEDYEALYPPRSLPPGTPVTRIAPSPTGYLHIGVFFSALVNRMTAGKSGIFYFRLEDTDQKREMEGGADNLLAGMNALGLTIDEGYTAPGRIIGDYGPYQQRLRVDIYHCYAKWLVEQGLAYPCFCGEAARQEIRRRQENDKLRTGYYGAFAPCRHILAGDAVARVAAGEPFVLRVRSAGNGERRMRLDDQIRGGIEMPENDEDFVLLKSDGIPTYHFAHVVDDHLMRTTHVIRGDEWLASVPKHLQLFRFLGCKPPKYAHIAPIMKEEGGGKRKLSKRKDPEAAVDFLIAQGYPPEGVAEYLMTIINSDYEMWRAGHTGQSRYDFSFSLKKMSVSGALFDMVKMYDICKATISAMTARQVADAVISWAKVYDEPFYRLLAADIEYTAGIFAIDRDIPKPRKDIGKWSDAKGYAAYFFDSLFTPDYALPDRVSPPDAAAVLAAYMPVYDPCADKTQWFDTVKSICAGVGYSPDVKAYKQNPDGWKGHVGDVSAVIRLAVTGRGNTPDLCGIMRRLGMQRVRQRMEAARKVWNSEVMDHG